MRNGQPNDKYAINIYRAIENFGTGPSTVPNLDTSGETPNHTEERFAGAYGNSPDSWRFAIVEWYGHGISQRGNRAKNSTDESLFSISHDGHYMAARGPALLFGMKAKHKDVIDTMIRVWKGDLAAFKMIATPDQTMYACPCARLLDGADQRQNVIVTFRWLQGKKIHQPKMIATSPDWLGLHAFQLIEEAYAHQQEWAMDWPAIKQEIASGRPQDILPLKNTLVVDKSDKGHRAYFKTFNQLGLTIGKWAWIEYANPGLVKYGVDDPGVINPVKGTELLAANAMPDCPGSNIQTFTFPLATGWK